MVLHHVLRLQCLHDDDLVLVNDPSRQFVKEVLALVCDFLVSLGEDQPGFFTILASDFLSRQRPLRLLDLRFGFSEKAWVFDLLRDHLVVRHDGEVLQTEIDPDLVLGWDPWFIVLFDEDGDKELARPRHRHRRRPDDALERAMLCEPHEPDLRQTDLARLDTDRTVLVVRRVGGARPPSRFEGREAAHPGEELRERGVEVQLRVREREAVRLGEEREEGLVGGGCRRFPSRSAPRLRLLADGDPVLEQLVVDEACAADRPDQEIGLCRRRMEPVCVAFQHVRPSSLQKIVMCPPHPIPAEGEGESDVITNFCS